MDVDGDQRAQSDACLFGQFPSHQLHDVVQLILELFIVVLQTLQRTKTQVSFARLSADKTDNISHFHQVKRLFTEQSGLTSAPDLMASCTSKVQKIWEVQSTTCPGHSFTH